MGNNNKKAKGVKRSILIYCKVTLKFWIASIWASCWIRLAVCVRLVCLDAVCLKAMWRGTVLKLDLLALSELLLLLFLWCSKNFFDWLSVKYLVFRFKFWRSRRIFCATDSGLLFADPVDLDNTEESMELWRENWATSSMLVLRRDDKSLKFTRLSED